MMRLVAVLALIVTSLAMSAQDTRPRDLFEELFARTMVKRQSIHSIRAKFIETTTSSLLQRPLVAHGTVVAAPPMHVLMTYTDPERRLVLIDATSLTIVWPDRNEREKIDIEQTQKRIDQYFTQASLAQLRSMFDIDAEPDRLLAGTDRVEMRPKRKQIKEGLEKLELWIDRETLLLQQMQMSFPAGDTKTIRLEDVTVNGPITDETFRIRP